MMSCLDCPRRCQAQRTPQSPGFCGVSSPEGSFRVARIMVHPYEEPFISGRYGSGTVFFSGCALRCVFCQNASISRRGVGNDLDEAMLADQIMRLAAEGVHNINFVTASHYLRDMPRLIKRLRHMGLQLPLVWNSSAYETVESLQQLDGLMDIYLPDFKFHDGALSWQLAGATDYRPVAIKAIKEMVRQQPQTAYDEDGIMKRGTAIRHLVLPGQHRDSLRVIDTLAQIVPPDTPLSIMSQYTPPDDAKAAFLEAGLDERLSCALSRRITSYEYQKVIDRALERGFTRILTQDRSSATRQYTPDFKQPVIFDEQSVF